MADSNLIQRGDLQSRLVSALRINERSPAPTLEPTIQAIVILEDLTKQTPFLQAIARECFAAQNVPAVVGEFGQFDLENPAGSGIIAVVTGVCSDVVGTYSVGRITGNPAVTVAGVEFFDRRNGVVPTCRAFTGSDPISVIAGPFFRFLVSETRIHSLHLVLLPGERVSMQISTANLTFTPAFYFTEYIT